MLRAASLLGMGSLALLLQSIPVLAASPEVEDGPSGESAHSLKSADSLKSAHSGESAAALLGLILCVRMPPAAML